MIQHLMGLATAVLAYVLVRWFGLPEWAGCLAALPVLFDAYQVELEHLVLSDTLFTLLLTLAVLLAMRRSRPRIGACAAVGALLSTAMLTRPAALPLIALLFVYLAVRRVGRRGLGALSLALTVPLAAYALW